MAKILIIDDSEVIRNLLTEFLGELGYQVDSESVFAGFVSCEWCDLDFWLYYQQEIPEGERRGDAQKESHTQSLKSISHYYRGDRH